jgi:TonB family protein
MNGFATGVNAKVRRSTILVVTIVLFFTAAEIEAQSKDASSNNGVSLQETETSTTSTPLNQIPGVEVLSDTLGVDFGPYVRSLIGTIKKNWIPLIPAEARPGGSMHGETLIRLSISPDGKIKAMHVDRSSGHVNIDRAAWGAITAAGQFPPPPTGFKGSSFDLRMNFVTNQRAAAPEADLGPVITGASMPR